MGLLSPIKEIFFGKDEANAGQRQGEVRAYFSLEGENADGSYVFVSQNEMPGRAILSSDGTFYFISMTDPDDKESLDDADKRLFFSVKFFVKKEDFDLLKKQIQNREEEIAALLEKKKKLEETNELLRREKEKLESEARALETHEEMSVKENPVTVETMIESGMPGTDPKEKALALQESRTIFLDYTVQGITDQEEKELADILTTTFARNVVKKQMKSFAEYFMGKETDADVETYLKLAAFASCGGIMQKYSKELQNQDVETIKEVNRSLLNDVKIALNDYIGDSDYQALLYRDRLTVLQGQIEGPIQKYANTVEQMRQDTEFQPAAG